MEKLGATFVNGDGGDHLSFLFADALEVRRGADSVAFNVERAPFDAALLDAAREAGAEVRNGPPCKAHREARRRRRASRGREGGEIAARGADLVDASGQSTVVGRHLGIRRVLPIQKKVAYFGQFEAPCATPADPAASR